MRLTKKHAERISAALAGIEPLVVSSLDEQRRLLQEWHEKLKSKDGRRSYSSFGETYSGSYVKGQGRPHLSLHLQTPHRGYYDTIYSDVKFNEDNQLTLGVSSYNWSWSLGGLHDLEKFTRLANEFFEDKHKEDLRREKLQNLKTNSIVAKLAEIAKEDNFEYAYEQNARQVNLYVKLPGGNALGIQVPFGRFQEVMQQVRPLVKSVRELTEGGVVFSIKKAGWRNWISPKK